MRFVLAAALTAIAAPTFAETRAAPLIIYPVEPAFNRARPFDCPGPTLQHTTRPTSTAKRTLAEQPPAWRLHAVERTVRGCAVYPEAQKVSDSTGKLATPPPRRR